MVRIDRRSGKRVQGSWPSDDPRAAVIWEAFKPESEPRRTLGSEEVQTAAAAPQPRRRRSSSAPRRSATPAAAPAAAPSPAPAAPVASPGVAN
jgi:penicillin-binding protein 1A